jgi:hypothetical protein
LTQIDGEGNALEDQQRDHLPNRLGDDPDAEQLGQKGSGRDAREEEAIRGRVWTRPTAPAPPRLASACGRCQMGVDQGEGGKLLALKGRAGIEANQPNQSRPAPMP